MKTVDMVAQCAYLLINKDGMGPDRKTKGDVMNLRERWENYEFGLYNIGIYLSEEERTAAFEIDAKMYCSMEHRKCSGCALSSYGLDCHGNKIGLVHP